MNKQLKLIKNETIIKNTGDGDGKDKERDREAAVEALSKTVSQWYVRKDNKYYALDRLNVKLSKDDVQQACLIRIKEEFDQMYHDPDILKEVFKRTMESKHSVRD